jgi:hypothetical protein
VYQGRKRFVPDKRVTRWWRRGLAVVGLSCLLGTAVVALTGSPAPADTPAFSRGQASAFAQSFKVNPTASALSVGFTFGQALAGYQNTGAKADARGIDLGIIGSLLSGAQCDNGKPPLPADQQPQPVTADSRDPASNSGRSAQERINKQAIPVINMTAKATPTPLAQADTYYAPLAAPGLIEVQGAHSSALADLLHGNVREAVATVDIGNINIAGGAVKITNLHWEATQNTGSESKSQGKFTMGSLVIGGQSVPTNDPSQAFAAVNQVLKAFGVELRAPKIHTDNGLVVVDPMAIAVVAAPQRDAVFAQIFSAALPVRQAITDALLKANCHFGDVISVADITVGSVTGSGSFSLEIGGVNATSSDLKLSNDLQPIPDLSNESTNVGGLAASAPGGGVADLGSSAVPGSLGSGGLSSGAAGGAGNVPAGTGGPRYARRIAATTTGGRGGMLAAVAAVGFGLLVAAIEGDRRMMRRAQRMIPPEA